MRRSGFTLMELLVVIGIIMLLMGMLFPVFGMVRAQAAKTKCRTLIHQVDAACDIYRNLNGSYPDTPASWTGTTMKDIFMPGGTVLTADAAALTEANWATVADMLLMNLKTIDRDHFGTMPALVDPWKQPLHYRPVQYYFFNNTGSAKEIDKDPPPHPDSYQLWSCGIDEHDDYGESTSDDITNWK